MKLGVMAAALACIVFLGQTGCDGGPHLGTVEDISRVVVYAPSGGAKLLDSTDASVIESIHAPLAVAKADSGSINWNVQNQLLKISLFTKGGIEKRIVVFRDKRLKVLGEGPSTTTLLLGPMTSGQFAQLEAAGLQ